MLIFVFAGEGSGMVYNKLTNNGSATPVGLVAASLSHAFALFVAVSVVGANISGGTNLPSLSVPLSVATLPSLKAFCTGLLSCSAMWLLACFLNLPLVDWKHLHWLALSSGVVAVNALVFEIVMTFGLVYTVCTTAVDPKKGDLGIIDPIAIGFIVGANILAGGAFDGASINPTVPFGPAVVSWTWKNHWVYWLDQYLIGSTIPAIVYEIFFISPNTHEQLPTTTTDY